MPEIQPITPNEANLPRDLDLSTPEGIGAFEDRMIENARLGKRMGVDQYFRDILVADMHGVLRDNESISEAVSKSGQDPLIWRGVYFGAKSCVSALEDASTLPEDRQIARENLQAYYQITELTNMQTPPNHSDPTVREQLTKLWQDTWSDLNKWQSHLEEPPVSPVEKTRLKPTRYDDSDLAEMPTPLTEISGYTPEEKQEMVNEILLELESLSQGDLSNPGQFIDSVAMLDQFRGTDDPSVLALLRGYGGTHLEPLYEHLINNKMVEAAQSMDLQAMKDYIRIASLLGFAQNLRSRDGLQFARDWVRAQEDSGTTSSAKETLDEEASTEDEVSQERQQAVKEVLDKIDAITDPKELLTYIELVELMEGTNDRAILAKLKDQGRVFQEPLHEALRARMQEAATRGNTEGVRSQIRLASLLGLDTNPTTAPDFEYARNWIREQEAAMAAPAPSANLAAELQQILNEVTDKTPEEARQFFRELYQKEPYKLLRLMNDGFFSLEQIYQMDYLDSVDSANSDNIARVAILGIRAVYVGLVPLFFEYSKYPPREIEQRLMGNLTRAATSGLSLDQLETRIKQLIDHPEDEFDFEKTLSFKQRHWNKAAEVAKVRERIVNFLKGDLTGLAGARKFMFDYEVFKGMRTTPEPPSASAPRPRVKPAATPPAPPVERPKTPEKPSRPITVVVPENIRGKELITYLNSQLQALNPDQVRVQVGLKTLAEYIKDTIKFPKRASFDGMPEVTISGKGSNQTLRIRAKVSAPFGLGGAEFSVQMKNNGQGGIEIASPPKIQLTGMADSDANREEINKKLGEINTLLTSQANQRIDSRWAVEGLEISGGRIVFKGIKKEFRQKLENIERLALELIEKEKRAGRDLSLNEALDRISKDEL